MAAEAAPAWRVELSVAADAAPIFEAALAELGGAIGTEAPEGRAVVTIQVYLNEAPAHDRLTALLAAAALAAGVAVPEAEVARLPETDWVAESHKALPALQAGPFYVYGAHVTEPAPPDSIPIRIEAGPAFGTGRHESTRGCLLALAELAKTQRVTRALDMGCGSALLAIAIAKLWDCPVLAVDNDPEAVRAAAANAAGNDVAELVAARRGVGYDADVLGPDARFDLIAANILAGPLRAMAPDLQRRLAPGGLAVLSGLLADQADAVAAAHAPLEVKRRLALGDWVTLVLARPEAGVTRSDG